MGFPNLTLGEVQLSVLEIGVNKQIEYIYIYIYIHKLNRFQNLLCHMIVYLVFFSKINIKQCYGSSIKIEFVIVCLLTSIKELNTVPEG